MEADAFLLGAACAVLACGLGAMFFDALDLAIDRQIRIHRARRAAARAHRDRLWPEVAGSDR